MTPQLVAGMTVFAFSAGLVTGAAVVYRVLPPPLRQALRAYVRSRRG